MLIYGSAQKEWCLLFFALCLLPFSLIQPHVYETRVSLPTTMTRDEAPGEVGAGGWPTVTKASFPYSPWTSNRERQGKREGSGTAAAPKTHPGGTAQTQTTHKARLLPSALSYPKVRPQKSNQWDFFKKGSLTQWSLPNSLWLRSGQMWVYFFIKCMRVVQHVKLCFLCFPPCKKKENSL